MTKPIELRKERKARKPQFKPQDSWKRARVSDESWRKPRGLHSKMRLNKRGNPKTPSPGYRAPRQSRNMHPSGLKQSIINTKSQLDRIKDEGIIIAASVGMKKKLEIIQEAVARKITVLNINAEDFVRKAREQTLAREELKKKRKLEAAKEGKKNETKKEETKEPAKEAEEDAKKTQTKEMEKIITKRE